MHITQSQRLGDFYHKQNGVGYLPQYGGEQWATPLIPFRSFKYPMEVYTNAHPNL